MGQRDEWHRSCVTDGGACTVSKSGIATRTGSVSFSVSGLGKGDLTYDSSLNTDPDGDSTGTTITVAQPWRAAGATSHLDRRFEARGRSAQAIAGAGRQLTRRARRVAPVPAPTGRLRRVSTSAPCKIDADGPHLSLTDRWRLRDGSPAAPWRIRVRGSQIRPIERHAGPGAATHGRSVPTSKPEGIAATLRRAATRVAPRGRGCLAACACHARNYESRSRQVGFRFMVCMRGTG